MTDESAPDSLNQPMSRSTALGHAARLHYFDWIHGNSAALKLLANRGGWANALELGLRLKWRLWTDNPFSALNKARRPTSQEKLSQHQMAPMIVLYRLLQEKQLGEPEILALLRQLTDEVALAYLRFSIPAYKRSQIDAMTAREKTAALKDIGSRFFNVESELELVGELGWNISIKRCHFAHYCHALGLPQLAPLFCHADEIFFAQDQPDVVFFRSQTWASEGKPCDFSFRWRDGR